MNKLFLFMLFTLSLVGCAPSISDYTAPNGNNARVGGSFHRDSFNVWQRVELISIDNKNANYGFFQSGVAAKVPVSPGEHSFVANVKIGTGFDKGPYESIIAVRANVHPGVGYQLKGAINEDKINTWLENDNGTRVSSIFSGSYHTAPIDNVMIMPVVVPR